MRTILTAAILTFSTLVYAGTPADITLTKDNMVVLNDKVSWKTVTKLSLDLLLMSSKLKNTDVIYLVINSPGGSVSAGSLFIDILKHIPQPVHSITIFGASMGFHIAQASDVRLILNSGTLMSHRAFLSGLEGQINGEIESRIGYYKSMSDILDKEASSRMGLSLKEYKGRIFNGMWHVGSNAVQNRSADKVVSVTCNTALLDSTYIEVVSTPFGDLPLVFSSCPLIVYPLRVANSAGRKLNKKSRKKLNSYINLLFNNKEDFVKKYISTGVFNR